MKIFKTFITSSRFLAKSKTYTVINLSGLVLGLTAAFILLVFIINELSYNQCHANYERLFRVIIRDQKSGTREVLTPYVLKNHLQNAIPSCEDVSRIIKLPFSTGKIFVKRNDLFYNEEGFMCSDPEIFKMLSFTFLKGSEKHLLIDSNQIILSSRAAETYFGKENPVGKKLEIKTNGRIYTFTVQAVFENFPLNSTFQADFIASTLFFESIMWDFYPGSASSLTSKTSLIIETIILLKGSDGLENLEEKNREIAKTTGLDSLGLKIVFQPFNQIYLDSEGIQNDYIVKGHKSNLLVYGSLAAFILLLAGINYAILSTARSVLRFKEIGVRKVLGASRKQLINQILTESFLLTLIAFPLSLLLLGLVNPFIGQLYGYEISLYRSNMFQYIILFAIIILSIGFLSGTYVAAYLSALDPLTALKLKLFSFKRLRLGKVFIIFQLFITLGLLIGFLTIFQQITFLLKRDIGIQKENLMLVTFNPKEFKNFFILKNEVKKNPHVIAAAGISIQPPLYSNTCLSLKAPGTDKEIQVEFLSIDNDFFTTMGIKILHGKGFTISDSDQTSNKILVNQEMMKVCGMSTSSGLSIGHFRNIGVVPNFFLNSIQTVPVPTIFCFRPSVLMTLIIRYEAGTEKQVREELELIWRKIAPDQPFDCYLFDKEFNSSYAREKNFGRIVASFTILAFIITGMGLFGLALLLSERRMKEVAIRKVLGASDLNIMYQMQKEFLIYIFIASLFAFPVVWYLLHLWLDQFYYHIQLRWYVFAAATLAVGSFVSMILIIRTRKVIRENPLNALKYE